MKKNLFVLALSAFVLTNAQPSYAVKANEVDENEKKSSRVRSLLKPKPETTKKKKSSTILRVPSAPMKPEQVQVWIKKINDNPLKYSKYHVVDNVLWELVISKPQPTEETWVPSAPMKPEQVQVWIKKINNKPWKYTKHRIEGDTLWISQ